MCDSENRARQIILEYICWRIEEDACESSSNMYRDRGGIAARKRAERAAERCVIWRVSDLYDLSSDRTKAVRNELRAMESQRLVEVERDRRGAARWVTLTDDAAYARGVELLTEAREAVGDTAL